MLFRDTLRTEFLIRGEPIFYWQYLGHCPCYDDVSGSWDRADTLCGGTGLLHQAVDVSAFLALVTGFTSRMAYSKTLGQLAEGDIVVSAFPDEIPLAEQDLIMVPSRTRIRTEQVIRGATSADPLRLPWATQIDTVLSAAGPLAATTYSLAVDAQGTSTLVWISGAPVAGSRLAVRYRYNPQFVVVAGTVTERRPDINGDPMPVRVGATIRNKTEMDQV